MPTWTKYWLGGALTLALTVLLTGCVRLCPVTGVCSCEPGAGAVHTPVTITGAGFGNVQGLSVVTFDGISAEVLPWSDTAITVRVPVIPTPGGRSTPVQVFVGAGETRLVCPFTVVRGILFMSGRDGQYEVYVMNPDGSGQTNLTDHPAADGWPSWSPDGTKVAFASNRDGNNEIYVMDADGTNQTRVTEDSAPDLWPRWSPDGARIAFARNLGPAGSWEIFVMNVDGTGVTRLTTEPAPDQHPIWSPDGSKILFATGRDGNWELYTMNADGSGLTRLTDTPGNEVYPSWSPDGTKIAFSADPDVRSPYPDLGSYDLYVMNADGTRTTRLTDTLENERSSSWSPDGTKIAYARVDASWNSDTFDVFVMNADGSGQTRLTDTPGWDGLVAWTH